MSTLLIAADPAGSVEDHTALHDAITAMGSWWSHVEGTWLVDTAATAADVRDRLAEVVAEGQRVLVIQTTAHWAGLGLSDDASGWLDSHT